MFSSDQNIQSQKQQLSQPNLVNVLKNKYLLTLAINDLSIQIQQTAHTTASSNEIGLKIENEAVNYIESLILDVFISILVSSVNFNNSLITPEIAYSEAMSNSSSNISASTTISSLNSVESVSNFSTVSASPSIISYKSYMSSNDSFINPILDLSEAKSRVQQVLPHNYADAACSKAHNIVEKCRPFMRTPKNINKLLKTFSDVQNNTASPSGYRSNGTTNELVQIFKFPLDKIHNILAARIFNNKLEITIYLVSILEFITKDILRLATVYVRCLGKHTINQVDVKTAIQADHALTKIFYSNNTSSDDMFAIGDDYDDEDELAILSNDLFDSSSSKKETIVVDSKQKRINYENISSTTSNLTATSQGNSNEECISDSSTICAESVSIEKLSMKYNSKIKELLLEQNQHLNDLNILRRIFMYLFRKCCVQFNIKLNNDLNNEQNYEQIIENIFGNINDLYDCALRLADLLDESIVNSTHSPSATLSNSSRQQSQSNYVGQHFWELAEGEEFSVYLKYALNITNYTQVSSCIKLILNNPSVNTFLQQTSPGLAEISKYLLPKLLVGSIYHFLYLYETIEYLQQISSDDLDKTMLNDSLDTLKATKYKLRDLGFLDSRRRPIETSFRMFQPHQLQQLNSSDIFSDMTSVNANNSIQSISQTSIISSYSSTTQALVSNIIFLTRNKWNEIERNVESFKLPTSKNQSSVIQIPSNMNNSINSGSNSSISISSNNNNSNISLNETNIKNAYLYEGYVAICKLNQTFHGSTENILKTINQSKLKVSQRYAYLFDGILILVKKQQNNSLSGSNCKYTSRFKQALSLDKCYLKDSDDDHCFELEVFNNQQHNNQTRNNQSQEFILFITETSKDKYQWLSMLCYSQYKSTIDRLLQTMTEEQNKNNPLPIPPSNYAFDQPDSPETILFDQVQHQNPYVLSDGPLIKAATLAKLIEHLTHYLILHPKFSKTFLMCYREFSTSHQLFSLLTKRYEVPDLTYLTPASLSKYANDGIIEREILKRYKREYQQPIRLKVINFMKQWINGYYTDDFSNDQELLKMLDNFIERVGQTNQRLQQLLVNAYVQQKQKEKTSIISNGTSNNNIELKSSSSNDLFMRSNDADYEDDIPSFETHLEKSTGFYDILTIHPLEFARQATLMEFELFKEIRPSELISLGWNKPERNKLSPNLTKLINLSNKFTYWYAKCIVDTLNMEERVIVMQRILDIASYFYEMNNFSGMKQIYAAFEASSVVRLEITREKAGVEQNKMYTIFKKLFENHDKKYLEHIKKCNPPCVPFLGSHLTPILKKQEHNKLNDENHKFQILKEQQEQKEAANPKNSDENSNLSACSTFTNSDNINITFKKSNLINFSKYRLLVGFVNDLLQYQNISYKFRVNDKIRTFILNDIDDTFTSAQNFYNSDLKANDFETKLRNSMSDSVSSSSDSNRSLEFLSLSPPDPSRMVEEWLFAKSKQIEYGKEASEFPKTRRFAFVKVLPPQSDKKVNKNLNFKSNSRQNSNLNTSSTISDINNNTSVNKSPLMPRFELKKVKSLQQQPPSIKSSNLFTVPFLLSNINQQNDIKKNVETTINSNYANSSGKITSSVQSSSHSSIGSFIRSSSSFQKQNRSSHKRSNSSVQISKQNKEKLEQPIIEQLKNSYLNNQSKNFSNDKIKSSLLTTTKSNQNDFMLSSSSTSIAISNASTLSLTSSASALSSSMMFPSSNTASSSNIQIPFGSIFGVSSSSSSPSPPVSLLQQSNTENTLPNEKRQVNKPSLSSSSMTAALSSLVYSASHGHEKLSLSSADSSSSAPNSPPPNYDEVFDSSSMTTTFNFNSTINSSISSSSSNNNCFDNKTYFQRFCASQQHSSSLSNLRYLETYQKQTNYEQHLNQQNQKMNQANLKGVLLSPSLSECSSSSISSTNLAFSNNENSCFKAKNKQFSVFSFPDFAEQNEELELLKKKTSSRTSSIDILTPPPFNMQTKIQSYHEKRNQIFNILTPPPTTPPVPPPPISPPVLPSLSPPQVPPLPAHLQAKNASLTSAVSQTSINSTTNMPAPPLHPPPAPPQILLNSENIPISNTPPPIPARPKKRPL